MGAPATKMPSARGVWEGSYTEEGAVVKTVGLNQEQVQASGSDFYEKNGLTEGAYTNVSDGEYRYRLADALALDGGNLRIAVSADKMPGLALVKSVDKCQSVFCLHSHRVCGKTTVRSQIFSISPQPQAQILRVDGNRISPHRAEPGSGPFHNSASAAWCTSPPMSCRPSRPSVP